MTIKTCVRLFFQTLTFSCFFIIFSRCTEDDTVVDVSPVTNSVTYNFNAVGSEGISGYLVFLEHEDQSIQINISVKGTQKGSSYSAHIHQNSAIEGGEILVNLDNIDGDTGHSTTEIDQAVNSKSISFDDLKSLNAHVDIHETETAESEILSYADIGSNIFTGEEKNYSIYGNKSLQQVGSITFQERNNKSTLATIELDSLDWNEINKIQLHQNTAAASGDLVIDFQNLENQLSQHAVNIRNLKVQQNSIPLTYSELLQYNGHFDFRQQNDGIDSVLAVADIGQNALTGNNVENTLIAVDTGEPQGKAVFSERINGLTLVTVILTDNNRLDSIPVFIHEKTAAEGGGIAITLNKIDTKSQISQTSLATLNAGDTITFKELQNYNGHLVVHESLSNLGNVLAQCDIGENVLTGESETYLLDSIYDNKIKGSATFFERKNGNSLVEITVSDSSIAEQIVPFLHSNTAAVGGPIQFYLNPINPETGKSQTTIRAFKDGSLFPYDKLTEYDGYISLQSENIGTIYGKVDIGQNALTESRLEYNLNAVDQSEYQGKATIIKRRNGFSLIVLRLNNINAKGDYPSHIHYKPVGQLGEIAVTLGNVNGQTGTSFTNVEKLNNNLSLTFEELLNFDGHIDVHLSPLDEQVILDGNIGSNSL